MRSAPTTMACELAGAHEAGGHVVADDGGGDAVLHHLPRGEARTLQEGPGLVCEDVDLASALDGGADDAERGAVAAGGERARVAVGEHAGLLRQQLRAESAKRAAGGDVLVVHALGFGDEALLDAGDGGTRCGGKLGSVATHALDGPEEIDRGGAGGGEHLADDTHLCKERGQRGCRAVARAEGDAHGGGDTDGRRAAHDHGGDDVGDILIGLREHVRLFEGETCLVEEPNAFRGPFECGDHGFLSVSIWNT